MEVEHVTSSPHIPQAWLRIQGNKPRNCLTNVRSMTQMFCLAFLNSPRDQTLGVPKCAQRLTSLCSVWCTARSGVFFQLLRSSLLPVPATTNIFPCKWGWSVCSKRPLTIVPPDHSSLWDFKPTKAMRKLVLWNDPLQSHGPTLGRECGRKWVPYEYHLLAVPGIVPAPVPSAATSQKVPLFLSGESKITNHPRRLPGL